MNTIIYSNGTKNILKIIRKVLIFITLFSTIFELIIFPSLSNFYGCLMMWVSFSILMYILRSDKYIIRYPFAFFVMISACLYRYLPVPSTLVELHPVSYGMVTPGRTFLLETFLLVVTCAAFFIACRGYKKNRPIQKLFHSLSLNRVVKDRTLWVVGVVALSAQFLVLVMGFSSYATVLYRVFVGFTGFMCAPILTMFPCLYKTEYNEPVDLKKPNVWIYIVISVFVNLATNSRENVIYPFATVALFYLLYLCKMHVPVKKVFNIKRIIPITIAIIISLVVLENISNAMLTLRSIRGDVNYSELIELTVEQIFEGNVTVEKALGNKEVSSYSHGWTEEYIDNFLLNRYANIRITDETLYYADRISNSQLMMEDLLNRLWMLLPSPILSILGIDINKADYEYSRGDALYYYGGGPIGCLGGYRVTSHVADGLITFGWAYFIIQLLTFCILFRMLKWLTFYCRNGSTVYSIFGLVSVFEIFGLFRNSSGIYNEWSYILRNYWQGIILFLIIETIGNILSRIRIRR